MTTFTTLTDTTLSQDKPFTQSIARALRDNAMALAEGDLTAPEVVGVSPLYRADASNTTALVFNDLPDGNDLLEFDVVGLRPVNQTNQLVMEASTNNGSTWLTTGYNLMWDGGASGLPSWNLTPSMTFNGMPENTLNGRLQTFNLSSSTIYKQILGEVFYVDSSPNMGRFRFSGYLGNTAKVNAVRFRFVSSNIASGYITMRRVRPS